MLRGIKELVKIKEKQIEVLEGKIKKEKRKILSLNNRGEFSNVENLIQERLYFWSDKKDYIKNDIDYLKELIKYEERY